MGDVVSTNLVLGPAKLYVSLSGAEEPPDSDVTPNGVYNPPDPDVWVFTGGTDGGINFEIDSTMQDLTVDQIIMAVGTRQTELKVNVAAKLSEITLSNISTALNFMLALAAGPGYATADLQVGSAATQPKYAALLIDGWAPYLSTGPALRRIIVRKAASTTKVGLMHDRKTQQGLDCNWSTYYVSESVPPVHIVDQQAA